MIILILVPGEFPDTCGNYHDFGDGADKEHRGVVEELRILERRGGE